MVDFLPMDGPGYPEPNSVLWFRGPTIGNRWLTIQETLELLNIIAAQDNSIAATQFISNGAINIPAETLATLTTYMTSIAGTALGAAVPPNTARRLRFPAGKYFSSDFQSIETWGTGSDICGDGIVTQIDGIGFLITDNKCEISSIAFYHASSTGDRPTGYIALNFNSEASSVRFGDFERIWMLGYDIAIFRTGFPSFEALSNISVHQCRDGMVIRGGSFQAHQFNIVDCDDYGILVYGAGEVKFSNSTVRGAGIANIAMLGARGHGVVESYWHEMTLTGTDTILFPILAVNDVGGFGELVIGTEIDVTAVEDRGSIMTETTIHNADGERVTYASDIVRVQGTSGQVNSITVGAVELLSAPVAFNTSARFTCTLITAAINAGTGSHGFTAVDANTFFYINDADTATLGEIVLGTCSGGDLTVVGQNFIAFITATPHGFTLGQWTQFDTAPYAGAEPVRYVEDANTFLWLMPNFGGTATGKVWEPHWYTTETNTGRIVSNTFNALIPTITAVTNVTVTTSFAYSSLSSLGPEAVLSCPGNDLYVDCMDVSNAGVNDQFFIGGNINRTFIASGINIMFKGTRCKAQIIVVPRANANMRPIGITFELPARGRADDVLAVVPITGAAYGWGMQGYNINNDSDEGYWFVRVPAVDLPVLDGLPQFVETRWYQNRIDHLIGSVVVSSQSIDSAGTERQYEFIRQGNTVPQVFHSGGVGATSSTMGDDHVVATAFSRFVVEVYVPETTTITGISVLNGSVVAGNMAATLCTMDGDAIVGAGTASALVVGANAFQKLPLVTPYVAVGPRRYLIYVQYDNTTCRVRAHTVGNFLTVARGGVAPLGTFADLTPPTTFVANVGPICDLY